MQCNYFQVVDGSQEEQKQEQEPGLNLILDFSKNRSSFCLFLSPWVVGLFKTGMQGKTVA